MNYETQISVSVIVVLALLLLWAYDDPRVMDAVVLFVFGAPR